MSNHPWLGIDIAKYAFHAAIAYSGVKPTQWTSMPHADFEHSRRGIQRLFVWL